MSGITTTPHLHLQIDNEDAPFYPYWPFSLEDAGNSSMSFFDGVSNGLNKNALDLYSVDPIEFIEKARPVDGISTSDTKKNTTSTPPKKEVIITDVPSQNSTPTTIKKTTPVGTFIDIKK